ncbi:MarR family winged helix-turn-helix transcriptional regulator [Streptomyces sp. SP17BM10]|uniref:MarR family winged helix-turn-helix transcriptional regulator n=1 Tax=Streptomyces sp. SP17BM10 TaxID=3002530 RepID=UPI002E764B49|nr:MarR family winged helix-turn-helix transcriptional regulator [Streptomyces sp. SP17BM10]MEE1781725.1 MarR family winged helix-turn-helix transcriptional regulator [Streptomyces sp. SP17BM10]
MASSRPPACAWHPGGRGEAPPHRRAPARRAGTDARTVRQAVRRLEATGPLEREADPRDARARRLRVTGRGAEAARAAAAAVGRAEAAFFAPAARPDARAPQALLRALATGRPPQQPHRPSPSTPRLPG